MPRLVGINLWGGRCKWQLSELMREVKADFVCGQEAINCRGKNGGAFLTLDRAQQISGCQHRLWAPFYSYQYGSEVAEFGNVMLSKTPFVRQNVVFTYLRFKSNFDFNRDDDRIRTLVHGVVKIGGKHVNLLNYHGIAESSAKADTPLMVQQVGVIASYIYQLSGPVILATDLNVGPGGRAIAPLDQRLVNLTVRSGLRTTRTPHVLLVDDVSDYIFVRGIKVRDFGAWPRVASDHVALVLDFDVA